MGTKCVQGLVVAELTDLVAGPLGGSSGPPGILADSSRRGVTAVQGLVAGPHGAAGPLGGGAD